MPTTYEPTIHGIVGSQFGDLEFDVGRSVRWLQYFVQSLFITDTNVGTQRYWVVNWAQSFPQSKHMISGINFFVSAAAFRKQQFESASAAFNYHPQDWVIFLDGHEGLSVDNRSFPIDYAVNPFTSYLWREIDRATTAGQTRVVLPFFAFLRSGEVQNISYDTAATVGLIPIQQPVGVPYYLPNQGLPRMFQVSALQNPAFNWASIDTLTTPDTNCKAQIISYAYAHWNLQDIVAPATAVEPLTSANDDGWTMRNLISQVVPIGLPLGTWQSPASDPVGSPGPWFLDTFSTVNPGMTVDSAGHTPAVLATAGVRTPLYDGVFRLNLRDGLWYEDDGDVGSDIGNIPLAWDSVASKWVPIYDTSEWARLGVHAQLVLDTHGSTSKVLAGVVSSNSRGYVVVSGGVAKTLGPVHR